MAFLIPANLATHPDVPRSLRQAAQAFRDWLDNDVTVTLHPGHTPETSETAPDPHAERREPRSGDDQASERPWLVVIHPAVGIVFVDFAAGRDARALTRRLRSQVALRRLADETIAALGERRDRPLAHELSRQLADCVNVDVRTVDSLAWKLCEAAGISANGTGSDQYDRPIREALAALDDDRIADEHKYDAILLDEAQDLDESRTRLAFSALRHPWNDFVVAIDAAQNLYRRSPGLPPPARHPPGSLDTTQITGRGRTEVLRRNYRNTREILKFADDFLRAGGAPEAGDDDDPTAFVPPETAARSGPPVDVRRFHSDTAALEAVAKALQRSHDEGIAWSDMAVLSGNKTALSDMANLIEEMGVPTLDLRDRKRGTPRPRGEVRLSTLQLAKGLEFARVYIMGVDDIKGGPGTDETLQRRLLYVGMTRATEQLKIAMSGTGPIIEALHSARPPPA